MRRLVAASTVILLFSAIMPVASAAAASDSQVVASPQSANPLLFSVDIGKGSLQRRSNGLFTLTAQADSVVWFTDRPARAAGVMTTQAFVRKWAQYGFRSSPPNAALITDGRTEILELTNPRILGLTKPRLEGENLVFTARALPLAAVSQGIAHHAKRAKAPATRVFARGSLFIDDASDCVATEFASMSAGLAAARTTVTSVLNSLNQQVDQAVENGIVPTSQFETYFSQLENQLTEWNQISLDAGAPSLGASVSILSQASSNLGNAVQAGGFVMATWETYALRNAGSALQNAASTLGQVAVSAVTQQQACEAASSPTPSAQD
jgi:hypothetical protein